jgi:hypothetical protein
LIHHFLESQHSSSLVAAVFVFGVVTSSTPLSSCIIHVIGIFVKHLQHRLLPEWGGVVPLCFKEEHCRNDVDTLHKVLTNEETANGK